MPVFGLIGFPLSHSFSKKYFTEKFSSLGLLNVQYKLFPLADIEEFKTLLSNEPGLAGLNVTVPYKEKVIPFLNSLDPVAEEIGAVNTVKVIRNSEGEIESIIGFNTDAWGFEFSFANLLKPHHSQAVILGTGGSSKAVSCVLKKLGIQFRHVSRKPKSDSEISYSDLSPELMKEYSVIINTTPCGMYPGMNECPAIPYEHLTAKHLCFDLVYNPEETLFMKKAKAKGAESKNGLEMLYAQADKAWEIWNQ